MVKIISRPYPSRSTVAKIQFLHYIHLILEVPRSFSHHSPKIHPKIDYDDRSASIHLGMKNKINSMQINREKLLKFPTKIDKNSKINDMPKLKLPTILSPRYMLQD